MPKIGNDCGKTSKNQETLYICFHNILEYAIVGTPVDYEQKLCLAHKTVQIWL